MTSNVRPDGFMKYLIIAVFTFTIQNAYAENWISELPKSVVGNPPYMIEISPKQIADDDVPWTEIKHIDVIRTNNNITIYMTWIGRVFNNPKEVIDDFVMVNQEINGLRNEKMHDIGNQIMLRFIGSFERKEVTDIASEIQAKASAVKLIQYVSGVMIRDGNIWRTVGDK